MMSGALQAAITKTLNGRSGLAGWRWLFVINAVITVVLGFAGFFMIPDLPNKPNPRAVWFRNIHAEVSMERLARHGRAEPKKKKKSLGRRSNEPSRTGSFTSSRSSTPPPSSAPTATTTSPSSWNPSPNPTARPAGPRHKSTQSPLPAPPSTSYSSGSGPSSPTVSAHAGR